VRSDWGWDTPCGVCVCRGQSWENVWSWESICGTVWDQCMCVFSPWFM